MKEIWIQLILTGGTVLGGMFLTVRYAIGQASKKEKYFLSYLEKMETKQLEYYETKNGTIERISQSFTKSINKNTKTVERLLATINKKK